MANDPERGVRRGVRTRRRVRHAASQQRRAMARGMDRSGDGTVFLHDIYHRLLTIGWPGFFAVLAACYVIFNLAFAALYLMERGSIANTRPGSLADNFFFSVQTMATIGYGEMRPVTLYANILVTVEVLLGLLAFALATGLIFARFSRPTARVMFSRVAVVARHDGRPTLMLRVANERANRILEARVSLTLARNETTRERLEMRRFYELKPERARTPLFTLTWTVMHVIDESSPLYGADADALAASAAQLIVAIAGIDETLAQTIYARHAYAAAEIMWDRRFADILSRPGDEVPVIDYRRFHDTVAGGE